MFEMELGSEKGQGSLTQEEARPGLPLRSLEAGCRGGWSSLLPALYRPRFHQAGGEGMHRRDGLEKEGLGTLPWNL